jgi:endonuclease G
MTTRIFKLVYDQSTGRAWANVLPNTSDARLGKPMDYASFVKETGWELLQGVQLSGSAGQ